MKKLALTILLVALCLITCSSAIGCPKNIYFKPVTIKSGTLFHMEPCHKSWSMDMYRSETGFNKFGVNPLITDLFAAPVTDAARDTGTAL